MPAAPKPKSSGPAANKAKGAGLYTSGGRVYPAHGDTHDRNARAAEAYREWQAFNRAEAVKKAKPSAASVKGGRKPSAAKKASSHARKQSDVIAR